MADVNAFISYARGDSIVAEALDRELGLLAGTRFECFLDTKSIVPGSKWQPPLVEALKKTDWMICVFTGEQSEYCGFEIGIFTTTNGLIDGVSTPEKRIVCLHDVDQGAVPTFLQEYAGIHVTFPDEDPSLRGTPQEDEAWYSSEVGQFLQDLGQFKGLFPLTTKNITPYRKRIIDAAKAISNSFRLAKGSDIKESTVCQTMMDVHVPPSSHELTSIPDTAWVTGDAFPILGLLPPTLQGGGLPRVMWTELKDKVKPALRAQAPWIERMQDDIVCAAAKNQLSGDDVTFTGTDGKVYRPILGRHDLYMSGLRRFRIIFVETVNRRFPGSVKTSALLTSLVMASRFYFKYFERDEVTTRFGDAVADEDFQVNCRQLCFDLDRMEQESVEYGIGDPRLMVQAFGQDLRMRIEQFFLDWTKARDALFSGLSQCRDPLTPERRQEMKRAVVAFFAAVRKQNADYLHLAIERYREEMLGHLARSETAGSRALLGAVPDPRTAERVLDPVARRQRDTATASTAPKAAPARPPKSPRRRSKNGTEAPGATN